MVRTLEAIVIEAATDDEIASIVTKIPGPASPLIVLLGDVDQASIPLIRTLLNRAVIPAAALVGARIIDNGVSAGLAALSGQSAHDAETPPTLIGVAPHAADIEPSHNFVIHLPADWPDPVRAIVRFASAMVKKTTGNDEPVIVILSGGGTAEKAALVTCARYHWPVLLIGQTGGLADEILAAMNAPDRGQLAACTDPDIEEIVDTGDIISFSASDRIDDLTRILLAGIDLRFDVLADAWSRYSVLDKAAIGKQGDFRSLQRIILGLGVAVTFLAVVRTAGALARLPKAVHDALVPFKPGLLHATHVVMVFTPVGISILVAINSRFREGNKWILLRASAEAVKREIFRYRMRSGVYRDTRCAKISGEEKLAAQLKSITSNLAQTEVNRTSLPAAEPPKPESLRFLNPDGYFAERIDDQIAFFVRKIDGLGKQLKRFQIWIYIVGGGGTLLAAFNGDVWVALTTALAALLTTRLEMDQVENTLIQYNQALTGLRNISSWWKALSQWEKARPANIDLLVEQTETTLAIELGGWVQQMQSAIDKLTEKEQAQQKDSSKA